MSFEIVVARYNEDIQWLTQYLDHGSVIIYNKGEELINIDMRFKVINLPNLGRETQTYLYHIYTEYNELKDITIFIQGNIDDHIDMNPYEYVNTYLYNSCIIHGVSQNYILYKDEDPTNHYEFRIKNYKNCELDEYKFNFGDFFTTHINPNFPQNLCFYKNAIFAMSRKAILSRPRYFYHVLCNLNFSKNGELAHFMEHSWFYIPRL